MQGAFREALLPLALKIVVGTPLASGRLRELATMIPEIRRRKVPHKGLQSPASKSSSAFLGPVSNGSHSARRGAAHVLGRPNVAVKSPLDE